MTGTHAGHRPLQVLLRAMTLLGVLLIAGCETIGSDTTRAYLGEVWFGRSNFDVPESRSDPLDRAVRELEAQPERTVLITGHAYDARSGSQNMRYGKRRAEAAAAYMVERGIDPERIETTSRGDADPRIPNSSIGARSRGNRVEVYLLTPLVSPQQGTT
jgi:outer membrane protein OmpA-like peptidoglycan-associated protein